jgi:cytidine deaminase
MTTTESTELTRLAQAAWKVRNHARILGPTKVGAATLSLQGNIFTGCNIEHRFRSHDIHAEINALTNMTASGEGPATAIIIVAERQRFTPCGSCLDWIFELGGPNTIVGFQPDIGKPLDMFRADDLMPHYPH